MRVKALLPLVFCLCIMFPTSVCQPSVFADFGRFFIGNVVYLGIDARYLKKTGEDELFISKNIPIPVYYGYFIFNDERKFTFVKKFPYPLHKIDTMFTKIRDEGTLDLPSMFWMSYGGSSISTNDEKFLGALADVLLYYWIDTIEFQDVNESGEYSFEFAKTSAVYLDNFDEMEKFNILKVGYSVKKDGKIIGVAPGSQSK